MCTAASFQFNFVFRTPYAVFSTCEYEYESTELSADNTIFHKNRVQNRKSPLAFPCADLSLVPRPYQPQLGLACITSAIWRARAPGQRRLLGNSWRAEGKLVGSMQLSDFRGGVYAPNEVHSPWYTPLSVHCPNFYHVYA